MNIKNILRKAVFSYLDDTQIEHFYKIYYRIRYKDEMMVKKKYGENYPEKIFYIIRPRKDGVEGLLSLFWNVIRNIDYALEKGYEPIVDFKNYKTQYSFDDKNVWEYYFTQPTQYTLEQVYSSKNVIISGLEIQWYKKEFYKADYNLNSIKEINAKIFNSIDFSKSVKNRVDEEIKKLKIDVSNTLGLYLRGTDYIKLKPSGHPVQPTVNEAMQVVDKYLNEYNIKNIFLVTEDGEIYDSIKQKYGDYCKTPAFDHYIYSYGGNKFLSNDKCLNELNKSPYDRGMNYLIKMIILSKCGYLIGGNTNGMWAAFAFSGGNFKDHYIFDLGIYGK